MFECKLKPHAGQIDLDDSQEALPPVSVSEVPHQQVEDPGMMAETQTDSDSESTVMDSQDDHDSRTTLADGPPVTTIVGACCFAALGRITISQH